jgi:hypothetical protein
LVCVRERKGEARLERARALYAPVEVARHEPELQRVLGGQARQLHLAQAWLAELAVAAV